MKQADLDAALIRRAWKILEDVTPFAQDCGEACGARCCGGDDATGMWLLPGEEALLERIYTVRETEDGQKVAVCDGSCDRKLRPFSCRIFPLFPYTVRGADGRTRVRADWDPRAAIICPIAAGKLRTTLRFRLAVARAGRVLRHSPAIRAWMEESQSFFESIEALRSELERDR